jgi:hypothetical protein
MPAIELSPASAGPFFGRQTKPRRVAEAGLPRGYAVPLGGDYLSTGGPVKKARLSAGPDDSAIYFYVNAGAPFSPDLHIRFSHTPTLLDCYVGLTNAPPDCRVGGTGAVFAAERPDAVSVAHFRSVCRQRKNGGTCQSRRDNQNMSCTHLDSP